MIKRNELMHFLKELFSYDNFQDDCRNGLQIEGKETIRKIAFGVSFNLPFLEKAVDMKADAIIVHHGFFGKDFFYLTGVKKEKIKLLLHHDISLFGIHLPLDVHEEYGNNAQLFSYIEAEIIVSYSGRLIGNNPKAYSLLQMLDIFHQKIHSSGYQDIAVESLLSSVLLPKYKHGFLYFDNGPVIPEKITIISGNSSRMYRPEKIREQGIDTYICGSVDEVTPAISYETKTNFVNLGHYWSEKAGIIALEDVIKKTFKVDTIFIEVENVI
jgi:dinuclear metal center YbgI/SA1388 family protein